MPNPVMAIDQTLTVPVTPPYETFGTVQAFLNPLGAGMTVAGAYAIDTGFVMALAAPYTGDADAFVAANTPTDAAANAFVAGNRDAGGNSIYLDALSRHIARVVGPLEYTHQTFTYYGYTTSATRMHISFGAAAQAALRAALLAAGHNLTLTVTASVGCFPGGNGLVVAREAATVTVDVTLPVGGGGACGGAWTPETTRCFGGTAEPTVCSAWTPALQ